MTSVLQPNTQNAFSYASDGLRRDMHNARNSGQYYMTHELDREMDRINNGVNHMRLDSDLINSSSEWGRNFNQEALNQEKIEAASKMADGSSYMNQFRGNFDKQNVNNLQENQVREMHQWAGNRLGNVKQELHPYASSAQSRVDQFCDYIGVTDRFTGYRNNLTRGSRDPTKLGMAWLNPSKSNPYDRQTHSGIKPAGQVFLPASLPAKRINETSTSCTVDRLNPLHSQVMRTASEQRTKSIQERCGINTTFPGITEYMKRYNVKRLPDKVTAFRINPAPDFSVYGRPTAAVGYIPKNTEYQVRYEWPECSKIVKKPWLRK